MGVLEVALIALLVVVGLWLVPSTLSNERRMNRQIDRAIALDRGRRDALEEALADAIEQTTREKP